MNEPATDTKGRILDAAERLFAARGIGATSLRAIISEAGVNLAAVHYHFGSKDALLKAVVERLIGPLNKERIDLLDEIERRAGKRGPSVEAIVEAFIAPALQLGADPVRGVTFMKLVGRLLGEPELFFERVAAKQFGELRNRFMAAFRKALPALPPEEIMWRMMFGIGVMAHMLRVGDSMPTLSAGLCEVGTLEDNMRRLISYFAAGMRAPIVKVKKGGA